MSLNNVLIFGDSYSTFEGYIPEGYAVYYSENERSETDVRNVSETWWHQVISETDSNLVMNNSWSGSTIGYTRYNNEDCSETSSFICRFNKLVKSGFFKENNIDTFFIFGGTNDSWCDAPLGAVKYSDWEKQDLYSVLPAITYFFKIIKEELPHSNIICLINTELKSEITACLKEAGKHYGIHTVQLENIAKNCGHPTVEGMKNIKDQVLKFINNQCNTP